MDMEQMLRILREHEAAANTTYPFIEEARKKYPNNKTKRRKYANQLRRRHDKLERKARIAEANAE